MSLPIVVWTPDFHENGGGIIVLHALAHRLKVLGQEVYLTKETGEVRPPEITRGGIDRLVSSVRMANRRRLSLRRGIILPKHAGGVTCHVSMPLPSMPDMEGRPFIAVYPEIVDGNPLNAAFVVRWLLHSPKFHNELANFTDNELVFFYQHAFREGTIGTPDDNLLQLRWIRDNVYKDRGLTGRHGICRMVRKGTNTFTPGMDANDAFPLLDGKSHQEIADVFNRAEFFYCHDPHTLYLYYAALCGCTPVVIPQPGLDAQTWRDGFELQQGVAYGVEEIAWANATREGLFADMAAAKQKEDVMVRHFVTQVGLWTGV